MNVWHVYPENDLVPHILLGTECPCGPRVEWLDEGCVVVHNAWNERT